MESVRDTRPFAKLISWNAKLSQKATCTKWRVLTACCRKYRIFANRHTANNIISQIAILIPQLSQKAKIWKLFVIRDHLRSAFRETQNYRKRRIYAEVWQPAVANIVFVANRHTANIIISQIAILISQMSQKAKIWKLLAILDHLRNSFCETRNYSKRRHLCGFMEARSRKYRICRK